MNKKLKYVLLGSAATLGLGMYGTVKYFYNYAIKSGDKEFMSGQAASGVSGDDVPYDEWTFVDGKMQTWELMSHDGLRLKAEYLQHPQTDSEHTPKLMILVHGYTSRGTLIKPYAEMFYNLGYDVLVPDLRGHGRSEGKYIGFGWPDRLDILQWTRKAVANYDGNVEIGLWGISMGAATVMMASGEKLPEQVKAIIEDCGYTSTKDEMEYQLKSQSNLPAFPIEQLTSAYVNYKDNYNFEESSAVNQLRKNQLPMLFIHGTEDNFVPYAMMGQCMDATDGPSEEYSVIGADHAKSFETNPQKYQAVVQQFLDKYLK